MLQLLEHDVGFLFTVQYSTVGSKNANGNVCTGMKLLGKNGMEQRSQFEAKHENFKNTERKRVSP